MPPTHGPSDTIARAIRRLNSQIQWFGTQNRVRTKHRSFWTVFCARTGLHKKIQKNGSSAPIFHRQSSILLYNLGKYHSSVCEHSKNDAKPIFRSLEQCHNLVLILETSEIGLTSIFCHSHTDTYYPALLCEMILDWPQNMIRKFLELRSKHAYLCSR